MIILIIFKVYERNRECIDINFAIRSQVKMNKIIEDYVLLQKIGQGQYGNVYKAENRKNKQIYAVKVMNVQKFKHTPKLSEFTNNQIAILSKINNVNIIKFVEMLRTANNYYLVYEYCNGGTLAEHIKSKGRLTQQETIKIFQQLRDAFEALHAQNILHRDLKPTNILFHNGVVKLADFGFCKELLKESDMTQTMVGSPIYMAPQVLKGLIYDIRADIWSLGVILYQMLYGMCPYEESTIPKLVSLIDNTILRFPSDIPVNENLKILIKRMLTIKYRERITPQQFIKYPLEGGKQVKTEVASSNNNALTFKDVAKFVRRSVSYLAQTLDTLTDMVDDPKYLKISFLVYKILSAIQKDTSRQSQYWQILKIANTEDKWDSVYQNEMNIIKPFGEIVKEAISKTDNTLKIKMELETYYIDTKYYMELVGSVKQNEMKARLLNCLLISRHFMTILEKKSPDFVDYPTSKKSLEEKEQLCMKYAKCY